MPEKNNPLQMTKRLLLLTFLATALSCFAAPKPQKLVIYTYDSLIGKGTLSEWMEKNVDPALNVKVEWRPFSTGGEALNQVLLEGDKTRADIVMGVDSALLSRAGVGEAFEPNPKAMAKDLNPSLVFSDDLKFIPFDYGFVTILYNRKRTPTASSYKTFEAFSRDPSLKKSLAIEDPRTSTIGHSFLWWTLGIAGEKGFDTFWTRLAPQVKMVAPSWSAAYGAFSKGEANFVVSYTTSPAYHLEHDPADKKDDVVAMSFEEGHFRQIESLGIVRTSKNKELARKWVTELLSENTQRLLPKLQWMYPARANVTLPESFKGLVQVKKVIDAPRLTDEQKRHWIHAWSTLMSNTL